MWRASNRTDRRGRWVVELAARRSPNVAALVSVGEQERANDMGAARVGVSFDAEHIAEAA